MITITQSQIRSAIASGFRYAFPKICTAVILSFATIAAILILIIESANPTETTQEFPIESTDTTTLELINSFPSATLPQFKFEGVTGDCEVVLDGSYCTLGDWWPMTKKGAVSKSKPALVKAYKLAVKESFTVTPSSI
jgi:hypothetical protein